MPNYATALETTLRREAAFGGDNYQEEVPRGGAHAVVWPDPEGRDWDDTETLCGKPTRGMTREESVNPAHWPRARHSHVACAVCDSRSG